MKCVMLVAGDVGARRLGLGFTNPVGIWLVYAMCLCCGGVSGVAWDMVLCLYVL